MLTDTEFFAPFNPSTHDACSVNAAREVEATLAPMIRSALINFDFSPDRVRVHADTVGGGLWSTLILIDGETFAMVGMDERDEALSVATLAADWYTLADSDAPVGQRTEYDYSESDLSPESVTEAVVGFFLEFDGWD